MYGLDQTATVYTPHATTGAWTVVAKSGLACRLVRVTIAADVGPGRVLAAPQRTLLWNGYTMPAAAQVDVGGERWNVVDGTVATVRGPAGNTWYQRAEVRQAVP